jgi:hypothetical protein
MQLPLRFSPLIVQATGYSNKLLVPELSEWKPDRWGPESDPPWIFARASP